MRAVQKLGMFRTPHEIDNRKTFSRFSLKRPPKSFSIKTFYSCKRLGLEPHTHTWAFLFIAAHRQ